MNMLMSVVAVAVLVASVNAQHACVTPAGEPGTCVPAKECSIIVNILQFSPKPLPQKAIDYLKSSNCGVQNSVYYACCSARHATTSKSMPKPAPVVTVYKDIDKIQDPVQNDETDRERDMNLDVNNVDGHPNLKLLPLTECGRIQYKNKVFGSYFDASGLGEFPWNVLLQYQIRHGLRFQCGGALISSRYVLTAAHCVTVTDDVLVAVRVGEHNISSEIDCEVFQSQEYCAEDIEIEEVTFHPQFDSRHFSNDVALIRMKKEVNISSISVQTVCLPITEKSQRQNLTRVIVSGWGTTENNAPSDVLAKGDIPVISNSRCQTVFGRSLNITNAQICAGGENMIATFKGDSGGPLIANVLDQRYIQYGIISAGSRSCGNTQNFPGIYTKVSFYLKWILDKLKP